MEQDRTMKIKSFTDLVAWKEAHKLVLIVYRFTKQFPKEGLFGLTNQMRRADVSISSNIAEGFSRNSFKEKIHFYSTALGSLTEVQNQLLIARDVGYLPTAEFVRCDKLTIEVSKLLNGLIKKSRSNLLQA